MIFQLCGNIFLNSLNNVNALNFGLGKVKEIIDVNVPDYQNDHNIGAFSLNTDTQEKLRGNSNQGGKEKIQDR